MTTSSQAGKRRGKAGRSTATKHGALGINRSASITMDADDPKILQRQSAVAPKAEPSRRGAKQWTGGRRQARKYR